MDTLVKNLSEMMDDVFKYFKVPGVDLIFKMLIEKIMQAERDVYLDSCRKSGEYNKGNGYYERLLKSIKANFKLQVPRDRNGNFKPLILNIINDMQEEQYNLFQELYIKGLTTRDISGIMKKIYNYNVSPSTISNITKRYQESVNEWLNKSLNDEYYFVYIDALGVNVRRNTVQREQFYIVLGVKPDMSREILGVYTMPEETSEGWRDIFKDLKKRGVKGILCIISDELSGISRVIKEEFPETHHQLCLVHKYRNMLKILRNRDKSEFKCDWDNVFQKNSEVVEYKDGKVVTRKYTKEDGLKNIQKLIFKWGSIYPRITRSFGINELELYLNYLEFPGQIQRMIYTTNWIENLNKIIRRTLKIRSSFPNITSAISLIGRYLQNYEAERLQRYKVTSFNQCRDKLEEKMEEIRNDK